MLTELHICNFRLFEDLRLAGLKRVSLIAGKNNTGKTALLEALRILASDADSTVVNHLLKHRDQFTPSRLASYDALFNYRNQGPATECQINELTIRKEKGTYKVINTNKPGIEEPLSVVVSPDFPDDEAVFVPFLSNGTPIQALWDKIVLTDLEDDVLHIIRQTVEPRLVRLDVSGGSTKVRLDGLSAPVPVSTLGDGVTRMLLLALALVNAKGKLLLIDEFEAGLHHSVQEKLWDLLFFYAKKWDIQAFITTHSEDTLRTFYYVASRPENKEDASFQRLQFDRAGKLEVIPYDIDRLEEAMELNLEIC